MCRNWPRVERRFRPDRDRQVEALLLLLSVGSVTAFKYAHLPDEQADEPARSEEAGS